MDGKEYERDDLGDTQIYYRFGEDPTPGVDVPADQARSHNPPPGSPPQGYSSGGWESGNWTESAASPEPTIDPQPGPANERLDARRHGADEHAVQSDPPFVRRSGPVFKQAQYGEPVVDGGASNYGQTGFEQRLPQRGSAQPWTEPVSTGGFATEASWPGVPVDRDEVRRVDQSREGFTTAAAVAEPEPVHGPAVSEGGGALRRGGMLARAAAGDLGLSRARRRLASGSDGSTKRRSHLVMPMWQELPLLLIVAFCLAVLVRTFLLQAFYIPSSSMERTLLVGDRVMVNKIVYDVRQPARGDIVVFAGPSNWTPENPQVTGGGLMTRLGRTVGDLVGMSRPGEKDFIKRVIGVPGDRVSCCDPEGRIYVNGKGINEPYINVNSSVDAPPSPKSCGSRRFDEVLVPPGQLFVMGDNRIVSQDSRCQGTVPIENVIGRAFMIAWPGSRWDSLSVPETFQDIPDPVAMAPAGPSGLTGLGGGSVPMGGVAVVLVPLVTSLGASGTSGRKWRWRRRTLPK